jgi:hypothetical protein
MGEKIYSNTELNEEQSRKTLRIANHGIETGMRCHGNAMKGTGKVLQLVKVHQSHRDGQNCK